MSRFRPLLFSLAALLALTLPAQGQSASGPVAGEWSIKDVIKQEGLGDVNIDPAGERVLWVKRTPDFEKDQTTSDLHLTFLEDPHGAETPETIRLTRTGDNRDPAWSPGGQHIAFASSRDLPGAEDTGGTQLWLQDPRGGAARPLTKLPGGVRDFAWLDDERLVVVAREEETYYEEASEEADDDARVVEDTTQFYPRRLFSVNAESGEVERLSTGEGHIRDFAASPSGRYVVYAVGTSPVTADAQDQPRQYLLDLQTGEQEEIFAEQYFDPSNFEWTLDGDGFYATDSFSSDPENEGSGITELYFLDASTREYTKVPLDWANGLGYGGYSVTPGGIHVQLADGTRMKPRFYRRDGLRWSHTPVEDQRFQHSTSIDIGPDGETIVFDYSRPDSLPHYFVGSYEQGTVRADEELVSLNDYLEDKPLPEAEVIRWQGALGDEVNGILYYPFDYDPSRSYPLVTVIHGGPSSVDLDAWNLGTTVYAPLWAQRGAFVFRPNYHGSSNHGLEFVESIKERYYELEIPDIVTGIQHLVDEGMVAEDSLGVMGWSNGGILTNKLTVEHPDMFKVAAPGAGDVNWISDYGNCSFGVSFDDSYFGGAPWDNAETYIEKSPLFEMQKVRTPTLIQFGDSDTTVPTEQGWQHYRALQQIDRAPVRFLLYPGEGHGLRRLSHQRRKIEEDLAWFDTYLFEETSMQERVADRRLPDDSPLARVERMQDIARVEGRYGRRIDGVLLPEVVTLGDSLQVGRFEVTRAQWQAFRPDYDPPPGTENYPATQIDFDAAQAYVQWLREETGRPYRLLTEKEMKAAAKSASGPAENDLSYWAGYEPTPTERAALENRIDGVNPDRLLMPVGSRPPGNAEKGQLPLLFDLDGNAAEWVIQTGGTGGTVAGSSAASFADERTSSEATPPSAYVGLRIAVGE